MFFWGILAGPSFLSVKFLFLLALFLVLVLWIGLKTSQVSAEKMMESWQNLAADLNFQFLPPRGPAFRRKHEEIDGKVHGVSVKLSCYPLSHVLDTVMYTRWNADIVIPKDFVLYVHRKNLLAKIAVALGYDEIEIENQEFSEAFSTKSDQAHLAKKLLSQEVRESLAQLHSAVLIINETGINIVWSGQISNESELKKGYEALAILIEKVQTLWPKKSETESDSTAK